MREQRHSTREAIDDLGPPVLAVYRMATVLGKLVEHTLGDRTSVRDGYLQFPEEDADALEFAAYLLGEMAAALDAEFGKAQTRSRV